MPPPNRLPRWRGFNLPPKFTPKLQPRPFQEEDFEFMAECGFNWARLPLNYASWIVDDDVLTIDERAMKEIDAAVEYGRRHAVHVNIAFHRVPGFCVNKRRIEPFNLWKDDEAVEAAIFHWSAFAERYKHIGSDEVSFNLWNEPEEPDPAKMTRDDHERVARQVIAAIRKIDPARLIILDGVHWGTKPLFELADLAADNVHQSCRGYYPCEISHYKASWNDPGYFPPPTWPLVRESVSAELAKYYTINTSINLAPDGSDRSHLEAFYQPWVELMERGVGVHCGEMGCYNKTPHDVALAWLSDVLDVLAERNIGFAIWNLRGGFGVLDSEREDVNYETWRGHKLDRKMLELLRAK